MPEQIPERADIRQLRTQAKDLLRSLKGADALSKVKLSEAQLLIARKYGFESWPKLVDKVETPILIEQFKRAIEAGDATALERLLKTKASLRKLINEPMFDFDSQPILRASSHAEAWRLLPILVAYGADPNIRSKWWAGGFSALDTAHGETVDLLVNLGAKFDVWSAAGQGKLEILRKLLDTDPASVNALGGDGETPLHFAATAEIAELLIQRGADLEQRDVDHEGTPIQYQVNKPEILRVLLRHGAEPDIFTAVALNDVELARKILRDDPSAASASVGSAPFVTRQSHGGHIYCYNLGNNKTPPQVAAEKGSQAVLEELEKHISPAGRLVAAAWVEDKVAVDAILREHPNLGREMGSDARSITDAAQAGKTETVRLLLHAGLDPKTPGMDTGTAIHTACWCGHLEVVRLLIGLVPLDFTDSVHKSPPLGWAAHGSQWCRNPAGDYVGVVDLLLRSGADPNAPANLNGTSMLTQAGSREDVKEVLRKFGAK